MRFTANTDIKELARAVLDAVKALEQKTNIALNDLDENREIRDEVKEAKRKAIYERYVEEYAEIRKDYGKKADRAIEEIRKLGQHIDAPAMNPASAAIISMLTADKDALASQRMIEIAAKQIGDDELGLAALALVAERNGYGSSVALNGKTPKPRLTPETMDSIADDAFFAFRQYFQSHEVAEQARDYGQAVDKWMNDAERSNSTGLLTDIANGSSFTFGGDVELQGQFATLAANTEL